MWLLEMEHNRSTWPSGKQRSQNWPFWEDELIMALSKNLKIKKKNESLKFLQVPTGVCRWKPWLKDFKDFYHLLETSVMGLLSTVSSYKAASSEETEEKWLHMGSFQMFLSLWDYDNSFLVSQILLRLMKLLDIYVCKIYNRYMNLSFIWRNGHKP